MYYNLITWKFGMMKLTHCCVFRWWWCLASLAFLTKPFSDSVMDCSIRLLVGAMTPDSSLHVVERQVIYWVFLGVFHYQDGLALSQPIWE